MNLTLEQLGDVMPRLSHQKAEAYLPFLNAACEQFQIDNAMRQAAFLAQLAHESAELRYFEEIASGRAYEGRKDLGNTQPGDGVRFKGRGPIQLTGRRNYERAGVALGLNLIAKPELVATPEVGFRTSAWFWWRNGLNPLADRGEFKTITKRVNGGLNGWEERKAYYKTAKAVLGIIEVNA